MSSLAVQWFQGDYSDFSEGWYRQVGASLLTTMLLNLAMPHMAVLKAWASKGIRKCYDRRCTFDKSLTRKTTQRVSSQPGRQAGIPSAVCAATGLTD